MSVCAVSGTILDPSETAVSNAVIKATIFKPLFNAGGSLIVPDEISTTSASDGTWTLNISRGASCQIAIEYPPNTTNSRQRYNYAIIVPATSTALFSVLATEL